MTYLKILMYARKGIQAEIDRNRECRRRPWRAREPTAAQSI